jgi:hypothetical protein
MEVSIPGMSTESRIEENLEPMSSPPSSTPSTIEATVRPSIHPLATTSCSGGSSSVRIPYLAGE